jgi:hypothetical protein
VDKSVVAGALCRFCNVDIEAKLTVLCWIAAGWEDRKIVATIKAKDHNPLEVTWLPAWFCVEMLFKANSKHCYSCRRQSPRTGACY